jgi:dephospho-CoA kinase
MLVFGLTGGIGSGKSTVADRFRARGLPVIDADVLAREVVARGSPGLEEIMTVFGSGVLQPNGELDRRALADLVFAHPDQRRRLEAITHPRVRALAESRIVELEALGEPMACHEVPLLFEVGLAPARRPLVVVFASDDVRVARAAQRDRSDEARVRARIAAQLPLSEKVQQADYVIDNDGPLSQTLAQADVVLAAICAQNGIDPTRYPLP